MTVPIARRNLMHEKGRLLLSVAGIGASLALVLLLLGFRAGLYATLTAFVDNLGADLIVAQSGVQGMFASDSAVPLELHDEAVAVAAVLPWRACSVWIRWLPLAVPEGLRP